MSRSETTFEQDFKKITERAKFNIILDEQAKRLVLEVHKNKLKKLNDKNKNKMKKLVQLGVVNLYMDNTVTLSNLGESLVPIIKKLQNLKN